MRPYRVPHKVYIRQAGPDCLNTPAEGRLSSGRCSRFLSDDYVRRAIPEPVSQRMISSLRSTVELTAGVTATRRDDRRGLRACGRIVRWFVLRTVRWRYRSGRRFARSAGPTWSTPSQSSTMRLWPPARPSRLLRVSPSQAVRGVSGVGCHRWYRDHRQRQLSNQAPGPGRVRLVHAHHHRAGRGAGDTSQRGAHRPADHHPSHVAGRDHQRSGLRGRRPRLPPYAAIHPPAPSAGQRRWPVPMIWPDTIGVIRHIGPTAVSAFYVDLQDRSPSDSPGWTLPSGYHPVGQFLAMGPGGLLRTWQPGRSDMSTLVHNSGPPPRSSVPTAPPWHGSPPTPARRFTNVPSRSAPPTPAPA